MANVDRIIQDLIKGASRAGARVEFNTGSGREEKLATNYGGIGAALGAVPGGSGGAAVGGHYGGKNPALQQAADQGMKDACARYGLKEAFLSAIAPLAGAVAGPALARGALGKIAPKMLGGLGTGMKGQAFDMAASMGGQMLGGRLGGGGQQR